MDKEKTVPEAENENESSGKFKTHEQLLAAYNALEREFTKRCQLIKELQAASSSRENAQAEKPDGAPCAADGSAEADAQAQAAVQEHKTAGEPEREMAELSSRRALSEDDILAEAACHAEELSAIPEVMDACIARYKQKLITAGSVRAPEGMAVIVPAKRPVTLAEAKRLADSLLDKN